VGGGEDATAVAYVQIRMGREQSLYGVGMHGNIVTATLHAVLSAVNRAAQKGLVAVREPAQRIAAA
jgi:2-isopropylmalate synthase